MTEAHATFAYLMGAKAQRKPKALWIEPDHANNRMAFGVQYDDGTRETVGTIDPCDFASQDAVRDHVYAAYEAKGIDVSPFEQPAPRFTQTNTEALREELYARMRADSAFGRFTPGSGFYGYRPRDETPGEAFYRAQFGGRRAGRTWFDEMPPEWCDPDWRARMEQATRDSQDELNRAWDRGSTQTWNPPSPSRTNALKRGRILQDIIARATTNEGERANARAALATLMDKNDIAESEL